MLLTISVFAQTESVTPQEIQLHKSNDKVILSDVTNDMVYGIEESRLTLLFEGRGTAQYISVNSDGKKIGYKSVTPDGMQIPMIYDAETKNNYKLHEPVTQCGQVSFAENGAFCFTVGNELHVNSTGMKSVFDLGCYSNITALSPDGRYVAYNNSDDQILILDTETNTHSIISEPGYGYFNPQWSPDGSKLMYQGLNASIMVSNNDGNTFTLPVGFDPVWSDDSEHILYTRREVENFELLNSDIRLISFDGKNEVAVTESEDEIESNAIMFADKSVLFYNENDNTVYKKSITARNSNTPIEKVLTYEAQEQIERKNSFSTVKTEPRLDIPYVHQVYDVPSPFQGYWACAPTTSIMLFAHYNILPKWYTWCDNPSGHRSYYGNYIVKGYHFNGRSFIASANGYGGNPTRGGYGFMWNGSSRPSNSMHTYHQYHGLSARMTSYPPFSEALNEVKALRPYAMCVGLTSSGHLILAHDTTSSNSRSLVYNDPYGNKNTPGYPSYDGKNVVYDWPGYNNGHKNLNTVYWCIPSSYNVPAVTDSIVDDRHIGQGFYLNANAPASMGKYKDMLKGYDDHFWYTTTKQADTCFAAWTLTMSNTGNHDIYAYIPFSEAKSARYFVTHNDGTDLVILDQTQYEDEWAYLGTFYFEEGKQGKVKLADGSDSTGQHIVFDAVKWSYYNGISDVGDSFNSVPEEFVLHQNSPNPFNPVTTISYTLPEQTYVILKVYDVSGNEVITLTEGVQSSGKHRVSFNAGALSSGVYFYSIIAGEYNASKKMLLLK